jgi:hypothetical protein
MWSLMPPHVWCTTMAGNFSCPLPAGTKTVLANSDDGTGSAVATEKLRSEPNGNSACNVSGVPYCAETAPAHNTVVASNPDNFIFMIPVSQYLLIQFLLF